MLVVDNINPVLLQLKQENSFPNLTFMFAWPFHCFVPRSIDKDKVHFVDSTLSIASCSMLEYKCPLLHRWEAAAISQALLITKVTISISAGVLDSREMLYSSVRDSSQPPSYYLSLLPLVPCTKMVHFVVETSLLWKLFAAELCQGACTSSFIKCPVLKVLFN